MKRIGPRLISIVTLFMMLTSVSAIAHHVKTAPAKCRPGHSRLLTADGQAEVYEAPEPPGPPENLGVYGCVYGRRPFFLGPLPYGSAEGAGGVARETLAGPIVAYEEFLAGGRGNGRAEWRVVVRDLRNGRLVHRVPTGMPAKPSAEYVGVGRITSIVVKSDGAVAWIAHDNERTAEPNKPGEVPYFDVEALDTSGVRLLASGTDIDPSSLALAVGGTGIGQGGVRRPGETLYWTQDGTSFSTSLK